MGIQMADGRRVVSWQREAEHFHIHGLLSHGKGKIRIQIVYFPHTTPLPLSTSSFIWIWICICICIWAKLDSLSTTPSSQLYLPFDEGEPNVVVQHQIETIFAHGYVYAPLHGAAWCSVEHTAWGMWGMGIYKRAFSCYWLCIAAMNYIRGTATEQPL